MSLIIPHRPSRSVFVASLTPAASFTLLPVVQVGSTLASFPAGRQDQIDVLRSAHQYLLPVVPEEDQRILTSTDQLASRLEDGAEWDDIPMASLTLSTLVLTWNRYQLNALGEVPMADETPSVPEPVIERTPPPPLPETPPIVHPLFSEESPPTVEVVSPPSSQEVEDEVKIIQRRLEELTKQIARRGETDPEEVNTHVEWIRDLLAVRAADVSFWEVVSGNLEVHRLVNLLTRPNIQDLLNSEERQSTLDVAFKFYSGYLKYVLSPLTTEGEVASPGGLLPAEEGAFFAKELSDLLTHILLSDKADVNDSDLRQAERIMRQILLDVNQLEPNKKSISSAERIQDFVDNSLWGQLASLPDVVKLILSRRSDQT